MSSVTMLFTSHLTYQQHAANGHHAVCSNCQMHQAKVGALQSELSEARAKNRPRKESLLNFVKGEL